MFRPNLSGSVLVCLPAILIGGNIPSAIELTSSPNASILGAAMTQFPGVYQINIQVPAGITPGNSASLKVQIGGVTSAAATTIAIK